MSTQLEYFDTSQDALTLVFNEQPEQNLIESWMNTLFEEGQYLYFDRGGFSGSGRDLFNYLLARTKVGEALMPSSQRLLICYYLPLEELTEEWVDSYFERAKEMAKYVQINSPFDQHYMLCFNYRVNTLDPGEYSRIAKLLIRLGTEERLISRQIYLLRIAGFQEYAEQEHALVQFLHMLSRKDYHKTLTQRYGTSIRMFDYADYYEDRARNCSEQIRILTEWKNTPGDPGQTELLGAVNRQLQPAIAALRDAGRIFRRKSQLYPVSIRDFEGNKFTGYRCKVTSTHPMLQRRRAEYTERRRKELLEGIDFQEARILIKENYHYPDYEELKNQLDNGTIRKKILENESDSQNEPEVKELIEETCKRYETIMQEMTQDIPSLKKRKEQDMMRYKKEELQAGRYKSLEDCFEKIHEDIQPGQIKGSFSESINCIALVSGKCLDEWNTMQYNIQGQGVAYRYPAIRPCEIVELVEYDVIDMDNADVSEKLVEFF